MNEQSSQNESQDVSSESTPKPPLLQRFGHEAKVVLTGLVSAPYWMALLTAVTVFLMGTVIGALAVTDKDAQPQAAAPITNNTTINNTTVAQTPVQAPALVASTPEPVLSAAPFTRVAGDDYTSVGGRQYGFVYECESGLTPVQLWPGETVQKHGATLSLKENIRNTYGGREQTSVTLTVKLDNTTALPGLIINPAAHTIRPDLYNQTGVNVNMPFGYQGSRSFAPRAYTTNYYQEGITNMIACLQKK